MNENWLKDLQNASRELETEAAVLREMGYAFHQIGMSATSDKIFLSADTISHLSDVIRKASGSAVNELYQSARTATYQSIATAMAVLVRREEDPNDLDT